jgi:ATP-dependent exoDNAse (exonuclease V) alpha subunit
VSHGYAVTGHVAQGLTTDRAFVLASDELYREWAYTAMSRGRVTNRLYLVDGAPRVRDEIAPRTRSTAEADLLATLRQSRRQRLALDVEQDGQVPTIEAPRPEPKWWRRRLRGDDSSRALDQ